MYRRALRPSSRALSALRQSKLPASPRHCISTNATANKPRSWKGSALRWGLAVATIYWYNTSPIFADEPAPRTVPEPAQFSDSDLQTVDAVIKEKRLRAEEKTKEADPVVSTSSTPDTQNTVVAEPGSPEALEAEADQQGAFNPETGEINWDCPCLGGMADGPCGEEFKNAFSCFVYSKEEPKGMDCIEKFQGMQECFRKYPEVYGAELAEDETDEDGQPIFDSTAESETSSEESQAVPEARPARTAEQGRAPSSQPPNAELAKASVTSAERDGSKTN